MGTKSELKTAIEYRDTSSFKSVNAIKESIRDMSQKKTSIPKEIKEELFSFYNNSYEFSFLNKHKPFHNEIIVSLQNQELLNKIQYIYNVLAENSTCEFNGTMNKYRNLTIKGITDSSKIIYEYIDNMGNIKTKEESPLKIYDYAKLCGIQNIKQISPQELVAKINIKMVVSNKLKYKLDILKHNHKFGSCQKPGNAKEGGLAEGFYNLFNNDALVPTFFYLGDEFVGRCINKIMYDYEGKEYILLDRLYTIGILSNKTGMVYSMMINYLTSLGYTVVVGQPAKSSYDDKGITCTKGGILKSSLRGPKYLPQKNLLRGYYQNSGCATIYERDTGLTYDLYNSNETTSTIFTK